MVKFFKSISISVALFLTSHSYGADLLLQCQAVGRYDQDRLNPATLLVTVTYLPNYLSIDVDGPEDYLLGVGTKSGEINGKIYKGRNDSNENTFAIHQTVTNTIKNTSGEYNVSINRVTGVLSATYYFRASSGNLHITEYSGNCNKISNKQKF